MRTLVIALAAAAAATVGFASRSPIASLEAQANQVAAPPLELFIQAASNDDRVARTALDQIARQWRDGYVPMFIDMARLMRRAPRQVDAEPGGLPETADDGAAATGAPSRDDAFLTRVIPRESIVRSRLLRFLERQTGKRFDETLNGWREWMWTLPYNPHPQYADFKGLVSWWLAETTG